MIEQSPRPTVPPWLYKLFTGHQYPYVRRQAKFANRDFKPGEERPEPTREAIDAKFGKSIRGAPPKFCRK